MIPMCWKCCNKIVAPGNSPTYQAFTLIGCKEEKNIKSYDNALKICPLNEPRQAFSMTGQPLEDYSPKLKISKKKKK